MVPTQISAIPEFLIIKHLHLINSRWSLIVPALVQVFSIFLLRQHFQTIPRELEDAALIDGAGHFKIIRHVILPLSWPAIAAVCIVTGQYIWNDFFWPNLFLSSQSKMVAPLALVSFSDANGSGALGPGLRGGVDHARTHPDRVRVPAAPADRGCRLRRRQPMTRAVGTGWPVLRTYRDRALARVALPLGGIGTGTVSLGGRGDLRDWELTNRPGKGFSPPHAFFAIRAQAARSRSRWRGPWRARSTTRCTRVRSARRCTTTDCRGSAAATFATAYPLARVESASTTTCP